MLVTTPLRGSIPARRRQSRTKLTLMFTPNFPKTPVVDATLAASSRLLIGIIQACECQRPTSLSHRTTGRCGSRSVFYRKSDLVNGN